MEGRNRASPAGTAARRRARRPGRRAARRQADEQRRQRVRVLARGQGGEAPKSRFARRRGGDTPNPQHSGGEKGAQGADGGWRSSQDLREARQAGPRPLKMKWLGSSSTQRIGPSGIRQRSSSWTGPSQAPRDPGVLTWRRVINPTPPQAQISRGLPGR